MLQSTPGPIGLVWGVVLAASFLSIIGLARAGSALFWKPDGPAAPLPAAQAAVPAALVAGLVALTVLAGPVHTWLFATAEGLHIPFAYIQANDLPAPSPKGP